MTAQACLTALVERDRAETRTDRPDGGRRHRQGGDAEPDEDREERVVGRLRADADRLFGALTGAEEVLTASDPQGARELARAVLVRA